MYSTKDVQYVLRGEKVFMWWLVYFLFVLPFRTSFLLFLKWIFTQDVVDINKAGHMWLKEKLVKMIQINKVFIQVNFVNIIYIIYKLENQLLSWD